MYRTSVCLVFLNNYPTTFEQFFVTESTLVDHYIMEATDQEMMPLSYQMLQNTITRQK